MATANLSWTPVGGEFSLSQNIDYKAMDDVGWILHSNVSADTDSATITGLLDNVVYQFQISNVCPATMINSSQVEEVAHITCPYVSITPAFTGVAFSFNHLGGDVSSYLVELFSVFNVQLDTQTFSSPGAVVSGTFSGLDFNTSYKIRVMPIAQGDQSSYAGDCAMIPFTTYECGPVTGVSAVMS